MSGRRIPRAQRATMARMHGERALRRERATRFWQSIQWFFFASSLMARSVRGPALFRWAAEAQRAKALAAGGQPSSGGKP